jgi:16S rRNA pseudouridine516 synthase
MNGHIVYFSIMSRPQLPSERLDKILSNLGYTSRRGAPLFLQQHFVSIDGGKAKDLAQKTDPHSIRIDGQLLDHPDGIFVMINKPAGYVCSHDTKEGARVYDLLPSQWMKRNPVPSAIGRLDKDTTGLLLITDRTDLVHTLTAPSKHVEKRYITVVDKPVSVSVIDLFASGTLQLNGEQKPCLPARLELINPTTVRVTLIEGKYHQVKRMFAAAGYTVQSLHRESFGMWVLGDLQSGCWKECDE